MNRREAIVGAASLGVLGTGGAIAAGGVPSFGAGTDESTDYPQLKERITVETVDLPWSDGEPITVPLSGTVTVLEFWATTCSICARTLSDVTAAHERVGDDVQFISITAESVGRQVSAEDVETWWADHGGGEWPVGFDPTVALPIRLDVPGTPSSAIIDADGVTQWTHQGAVPTDKLVAKIEAAGGSVTATDV